jgi:hypothetical protein
LKTVGRNPKLNAWLISTPFGCQSLDDIYDLLSAAG